MTEEMKGPKKAPTQKKAPASGAAEQSKLRKACIYITKGVKAGVMSAFLANQALSAMGCGARTGLEDDMATIDKGHDDGTVDAGHDGCMAVDAGHDGCMGIDAGGSKPGIDAGTDGSMGIDAGGSKDTDDDGGSKPGPDGSMAG
jgi:hypothetical protein